MIKWLKSRLKLITGGQAIDLDNELPPYIITGAGVLSADSNKIFKTKKGKAQLEALRKFSIQRKKGNKMKRDYTDGVHDDVVFFRGIEIEKTRAFGMPTLFVVGTPPIADVLEAARFHAPGADEFWCQHIYLGANQSFEPGEDKEKWNEWDSLVEGLTNKGFLVTVDHDVKYSHWFLESCYADNLLVIPMVSIKIPYLDQYNYNACFKFDDSDFAHSNRGVWVHSMHDITDPDKFTAWHEYKKDTPI